MIKNAIRLNLNIDPTFYRQVKSACALRGVTISELVRRLLEAEMKRIAKTGVK